jgi:hypothetical protein
MSGNVHEWDEKYYPGFPGDKAAEDPRGPEQGQCPTGRPPACSPHCGAELHPQRATYPCERLRNVNAGEGRKGATGVYA